MSSFKAKPKQKSSYPGILTRFEEQRKGFRGFVKKPRDSNLRANSFNAQLLQRFSGKKGK